MYNWCTQNENRKIITKNSANISTVLVTFKQTMLFG